MTDANDLVLGFAYDANASCAPHSTVNGYATSTKAHAGSQ